MHAPFLAGLSLALGLLGPGSALAQVGHPPIQGPRPVHERLAASDRVVLARITGATIGRIQVETVEATEDTTPEVFEIKRSPLAPPPLEPGDHAILFLRGARPPYVLVDEPKEVIRWVDDGQPDRPAEAVRALASAGGDPGALAQVYLDWIDAGPATLRELGASGLDAILSGAPALAATLGPDRLARVIDPGTPPDVRRISAQLAARAPRSAAALSMALARDPRPLDPAATAAALRGAGLARAPETVSLLGRAAKDPNPLVRLAAARALPGAMVFAREETISIARAIAEDETDRRVREAAERVLRDAARPRPRPRRTPGTPIEDPTDG